MAIVSCNECGSEISTSAASCPKCGAPAKKALPQRISTLTWIVVIAIGAIVVSAMLDPSSGGSSSSTPSANTQAAPTIDKSPKMQADRLKLIDRLQREGIFGEIRVRSSGATMIVRPAFYALDFKDKQSVVSVVYAYHFDGSDKYMPITLQDSRTNKNVGSFSLALGLDLE
ncbi:MAG: zinc ribbon domain-containing protein [Pseudomonadota bacterium]